MSDSEYSYGIGRKKITYEIKCPECEEKKEIVVKTIMPDYSAENHYDAACDEDYSECCECGHNFYITSYGEYGDCYICFHELEKEYINEIEIYDEDYEEYKMYDYEMYDYEMLSPEDNFIVIIKYILV